MKFEVIITGQYEVSDDPDERLRTYGTEDPGECAEIDEQNPAEELLDLCPYIEWSVKVVPSDN